ncbi:recombination mediator RecR [Candidatus Gracilibacteria bacterium]|nr:recombination mediator RecR [Candidatus Gracilibacteria bacterium]
MPEALKRLIQTISLLPGIGENRATKLAFFLLSANSRFSEEFARNITELRGKTGKCNICGALTDAPKNICNICEDRTRNHKILCVVEEYLDLLTIEQAGGYDGVYHILGGAISPVNGVFVGDLNITSLFKRIQEEEGKIEIIIATNPNLEGEATSSFIIEEIEKRKLRHKVRITRLSRGLSSGYIEYADSLSLISALRERKEV